MEYKIVIVGEDSVGKTWLAHQMTQESSWTEESLVELCPYRHGYVAENEITDDAFRNQIPVKSEFQTTNYTVKIIDTTGLDTYPSIYEKHIRTAHGFCLVFSPLSPDSFENIDLYWEEIRLVRKSKKFPIIFISNRTASVDAADEDAEATIARNYARLSRRYGVPVVEASAEKELSVCDAFRTLMKEVRKQVSGKPSFVKKPAITNHCKIA